MKFPGDQELVLIRQILHQLLVFNYLLSAFDLDCKLRNKSMAILNGNKCKRQSDGV